MTIRYYPAIIERGTSGYGVIFPDLPGCTSAGDNFEDAVRSAQEAVALHIHGIIEDGEDLPDPKIFDRIDRDPEINEVARILVQVELPRDRDKDTVCFNTTMNEALVKNIDTAARNMGVSRSGFLADAARRILYNIQ